jgi:hypothetical protein
MMAQVIRDKADAAAEGALLRLLSRWVSLVLCPVLVVLLAWVGSTLWDLKASVVAESVTQSATNDRIAETNRQLRELALQMQALVPRKEFESRLADQDHRIDSGLKRLDRVEADALAGRPVRR